MNIQIEKMELSHLEQIEDVLNNQFDDFWNVNILKSELNNPLSEYIVALENNEVVGFAGIWKPIDEAHVTNIVTRIDKRHKHIGTKMLEELIEMAKNEKLKCLTLEVNEKNTIAINLYNKFNFKEVGKRKKYYNNADDAIIMTLEF